METRPRLDVATLDEIRGSVEKMRPFLPAGHQAVLDGCFRIVSSQLETDEFDDPQE